jgi:hypothetical protein
VLKRIFNAYIFSKKTGYFIKKMNNKTILYEDGFKFSVLNAFFIKKEKKTKKMLKN